MNRKDIKTVFVNIIVILKEEVNRSLKETQKIKTKSKRSTILLRNFGNEKLWILIESFTNKEQETEVRILATEDAIEEMDVWALEISGKLYFWVLWAELRPLTSYPALKKELEANIW